mmetsp:Transcript_52124/g.139566  ORF Transcript_52124/g.139566 Transcript_52124/m.139566 type:complete len:343 (-) Transcript_52124:113-1141(-)
MCTRNWCVLPVRVRSCTRVNQRSRSQNSVGPRGGTRNCLRARYLVTDGTPSCEQTTLPNSRRLKSCHLFIGMSTTPTLGSPFPPNRPDTSAMYSFCTWYEEFCAPKCLNASQDLPKICTPLVFPSRRWQMPRCRGSSWVGISKRLCATCMKFDDDASQRPLGCVTTNMPAGFRMATKFPDSARASTSHHWPMGGTPFVRSSAGVSSTSKHKDSASLRHQKAWSSSSTSSHQGRSSTLRGGFLSAATEVPADLSSVGEPLGDACSPDKSRRRRPSAGRAPSIKAFSASTCSAGNLRPTSKTSSSRMLAVRIWSCSVLSIYLKMYSSREVPHRSRKKASPDGAL